MSARMFRNHVHYQETKSYLKISLQNKIMKFCSNNNQLQIRMMSLFDKRKIINSSSATVKEVNPRD